MSRLIVRGANIAWSGLSRGGHATYVLQWLHGLHRLGHEVLYHDVLDEQPSVVEAFRAVVAQWDLPIAIAGMARDGRTLVGLSVDELQLFAEHSALVLSLGATYAHGVEPWLAHVHPRVLIDQDPGFTHLWSQTSEPAEIFGVHDAYFTIGANVGTSRSPIPLSGLDWRHTWNPVVLDRWRPSAPPHGSITTVASLWSQAYQEFDGQLWGPKAVQWEHFLDLPRLVGEPLEIAAERGAGEEMLRRLRSAGWSVVDATSAAGDIARYTDYIQSSAAEFSCVKGLYVGTNSGWFSDRSACYLAAGHPVVMQDTGLHDVLPSGCGLHLVASVDQAADAIRRIRTDYERESDAARAIAAAHFDSDRVLQRLLAEVGV